MKTALAAVMAAFLFMGATCSTSDIPALIAAVQKDASTACAFVPTAETIIAIFQAGNATLQSAAQIAAAICSSVAPHAATHTVAPDAKSSNTPFYGPVVAGVPVYGHFVQ